MTEIRVPLSAEICLSISSAAPPANGYPSARLQKGLRLIHSGQELIEEAVGFGVPVIKRGIQTIFAGGVELGSIENEPFQSISARYQMNLEERIARPGSKSVDSRAFYTFQNSLAAVIRQIPISRRLMTGLSTTLRRLSGLETTYEPSTFSTEVELRYHFERDSGNIQVEIDTTNTSKAGITEIVVMNEQGANFFDQYRDSNGVCQQSGEIGLWDRVTAESATFRCETRGVAFSLHQVRGATLFRGRERIGSRLAWSGFGYSFPAVIERSAFQLRIEQLA